MGICCGIDWLHLNSSSFQQGSETSYFVGSQLQILKALIALLRLRLMENMNTNKLISGPVISVKG